MGTGNVLEGLLAILPSEKIGIETNATASPPSRKAEALRSEYARPHQVEHGSCRHNGK